MTGPGPLASVFLEARRRRGLQDIIAWSQEPGLDDLLRSLWGAGRAQWPDVSLPIDPFVERVAERVERVTDLDPARGPDWYIACACAAGDSKAIVALEAAFAPDIEPALRRLRLDPAALSEARQKLRIELFVTEPGRAPKIASYAGRGELAGWLRVTAVRSALKMLRKSGAEALALPDDEHILESVPVTAADPNLSYMKELYRPAFKEAFREAFGALSVREQNLLRQHLLDGVPTEQLGALYRVHKATAARWVAAAREELMKQTWAAFRRRVSVRSEDCDSVLELIRSQLDLTLRRELGQPG